MPADPLAILETNVALRAALKHIAKRGLVGLADLVDNESGHSAEELREAVEQLHQLHLVDVRPGAIPELNQVMITADGLSAARETE